MGQTPLYYRITDGIRITVRPTFVPEQSRPAHGQYVFVYLVRIENVSDAAAELRTRRWLIHDSIGEELEVEGDGVVGEQPHLAPGSVHEYQSYCVLKSPHGYMEGAYHFVRDDGTTFDALIPRFALDAEGAVQID
ncbi:MAG TPA: Co2+/Mg2+ efflux protein ApaG [Gemmatimonadales bacterium]|nr:Co2+/Mg2+ efflux protein ApaG [Gemmatimonadales bacterium]